MSNNINRPSASNNARNALQKVEDLEAEVTQLRETLTGVMRAMSNGLNQVQAQAQEQISGLAEQTEAIIRTLGASQVAATIDAIRIERNQAMAAQSKANLAQAILDGKIVVTETVDEESIVTGVEYQANGELAVGGGYVALKYSEIKPEFRDAMTGKKVGDKVDLANGGGTFEIQQILKLAPKPAPVAAPAPAPEATEVAAVPEEVTPTETAVQE